MSPNMKLSVLAFAGAAAAFPQYNHGHSFHKHSTPAAGHGHAYPTGGWGSGRNATSVAPIGTGSGSPSGPQETTIIASDYTITSTRTSTVFLTQYPNGAAPSEVAIQDVGSSAEACGQTVYVTETNRVTVTVPAGGASSAAPEAPATPSPAPPAEAPSAPGYETPEAPASSAAPAPSAPSAPAVEVPTSYVLASSEAPAASTPAPVEEKPTSAAAVETPAPSAEAETSAAPASSVQESSAPASTPSKTPSTGGYSGGKRGLAYRYDGAADAKSFEDKNFGFAWNWEADTKGDIGALAGNFIPTLRTLENAGEWAEKAQAAIDAGAKVLFGFNEPDIVGQANLGYDALCKAWVDNMNDFYGKATIVAPGVSSSENENQGLDYLGKWIDACPDAKFDDINIHWYGPASAGFTAFKAHVEEAVSKFSGHKVWVTEFGLTGATPEESADFLKEAQAYLDSNSNCAGYSYFAVGSFDPSANLLGTASALSKTGEVYCN